MRIIKSHRNSGGSIQAAYMPPSPYDIGPPDYEEPKKLDVFDSEFTLYFDEPATVYEDGEVELLGDTWNLDPAPDNYGYYYDEDTGAKILSSDDVYEKLADVLNDKQLLKGYGPGNYRITGTIDLTVSVDDIEYDQVDEGPDEDGYPMFDRTYYTDDASSVIEKFTVSDLNVTSDSNSVTGADIIVAADDDSEWEELRTKHVLDTDGMLTDYTLYVNSDRSRYICMFGDKDIYEPDPDYADWEGDSQEEAYEWFDNYSVGDEEYDDDIYGAESTDSSYEDDIQEIGQEFTSENTSINSGRLPAVFNMVSFEPGTVNLDYGGGKFDNVAEYLTQYDVVNLVYDPYNRTAEHNKEVIRLIREHGGADTATCSNVLNVIKEPEVRLNVLKNIKKLVKSGGTVYITVYEGKGNASEGPTKSGYQLNRKTADYMEEVQQVFPDATRKGKLIVATNSGGAVTSATDEGIDIPIILEQLDSEARDILFEALRGPKFGFDETEIPKYCHVEVTQDDHTYAKVEVRAEVPYEDLEKLMSVLTDWISYYDSDAYFDAEDTGIASAFVNMRKVAAMEGDILSCNTIDAVTSATDYDNNKLITL